MLSVLALASFAHAQDLDLDVPVLVPGAVVEVTVTGLGAGETAHLLRGNGVAGGPCPGIIGGHCLSITNPQVQATLTANGVGEASYSLNVPSTAPIGLTLGWQAVAVRGPGGVDSVLSDAVEVEVATLAGPCPVYADPTVSPGGSGAADDPFPNVAYALEYRDPSCAEVLLYPGTYVEALDFQGASVHVGSVDGPETTIITAPVGEVVLANFTNGETEEAQLSGVTLQCVEALHETYGVWISGGAAPTMHDLVIEGCQTSLYNSLGGGRLSDSVVRGTTTNGGVYLFDSDMSLTRNAMEEVGLVVYNGTGGVVDGNRISATSGDVITVLGGSVLFMNNWIESGDASVGLSLTSSEGHVLANNTFIGGDDHALAFYGDNSAAVVLNNTIETDGGVYTASPASLPGDFSSNNIYPDVWAGSTASHVGLDGNISAAPLRDDAGHSLWGSALIDAGADATAHGVLHDMEDTPRPLGLGFDIGALESF